MSESQRTWCGGNGTSLLGSSDTESLRVARPPDSGHQDVNKDSKTQNYDQSANQTPACVPWPQHNAGGRGTRQQKELYMYTWEHTCCLKHGHSGRISWQRPVTQTGGLHQLLTSTPPISTDGPGSRGILTQRHSVKPGDFILS